MQESNGSDAEEAIGGMKEEKTKSTSKKQQDLARKRREESRSLAKGSDEQQGEDKIEPEAVTKEEKPKPKEFVAAPAPKIPAWSSGPPESIKKTSLDNSGPPVNDKLEATADIHDEALKQPPSTLVVNELQQVPEQQPVQNIPQPSHVVHHDRSAFTPSQHVQSIPAQSGLVPAQSNIQPQPILPPANALFPGNSALFGESEGSAVYGSWNPPPMVLPSTYVDPWKPNPFAPTTATSTSIGASLGSIWSGPGTKETSPTVETTNGRSDSNIDSKSVATTANSASVQDETSKELVQVKDELAADDEELNSKTLQKTKKQPPRKPRPGIGGHGKAKPGKEGKPNPCRKPGHDHDWRDCPDNRKSALFAGGTLKDIKELESSKPSEPATTESFPASNSSVPTLGVDKRKSGEKSKKKTNGPSKCRIEGHDHLWKDCPNNTKAAKGKGPKVAFKKKPKGTKTKGEKGKSEPSQPSAATETTE